MPLVNPKDSSQLLYQLSKPDQSYLEALTQFNSSWPTAQTTRFQAACFLLLALEEGALCSSIGRLQALQILFHLSEGQSQVLGHGPFLPFLLQASQDSSRHPTERLFIQKLFLEGIHLEDKVGHSLSPLNHLGQTSSAESPVEVLWQAYTDRLCRRSSAVKSGTENLALCPPYVVHKQQGREIKQGEVVWQHMQLPHLLRWDSSRSGSQTSLKDLQSLLTSALLKPLLPAQQQQVLKELELDRRLVLSLDLATDSLPHLVEHNPVIAFEVLVRLIQQGCGEKYLPALVSMEVSVHSMEVINRLSTSASLPSQSVHLYISNCIRSCQAAQDDKYMQLRRVRLVCVFLQSLIRNHIINVQDLSFEAQAFCIEFSRVREAAALFRLLKTLENGTDPEALDNLQ